MEQVRVVRGSVDLFSLLPKRQQVTNDVFRFVNQYVGGGREVDVNEAGAKVRVPAINGVPNLPEFVLDIGNDRFHSFLK